MGRLSMAESFRAALPPVKPASHVDCAQRLQLVKSRRMVHMSNEDTCFRCDSNRVISGKTLGHALGAIFRPYGISGFKWFGPTRLFLSGEGRACLDCGLFRSDVDKEKANELFEHWDLPVPPH